MLCQLTHSSIAQVEEYLKDVNRGGHDDGAILLDEPDINLGDLPFSADNISQANTSSTASDPNLSFDIPTFAGQEDGTGTFMNGQLMGLGMSETLPPFEVIEEL